MSQATVALVTGKGGTGKTTLSLALGLAYASTGRRALVVELGEGGGLARAVGWPDLPGPRALASGCTLMSLAGEPALRAFLERHLPSRRAARLASRSALLTALFTAAPGTLEVAQLDALEAFSRDYDRVIVDGEPSGHTLLLLDLPRVFSGLGARGILGTRLSRIGDFLAAPERFAVHVAALPKTLSQNESREVAAGLRQRGIRVGHLIVTRSRGARGLDARAVHAAAEALRTSPAAEDLQFLQTLAEEAGLIEEVSHKAAVLFEGLLAVEDRALPEGEPQLASLRALGLEILHGLGDGSNA